MLTIYHWSTENNLKELKWDPINKEPVYFSIHPTSHQSYGDHCYIITIDASDVEGDFETIYYNADKILEKYDEEYEMEENELEICFFHDVYNIKQIK